MSGLETRRDELYRTAESLRLRLDEALVSGTDQEIREYAIAASDAYIKALELDGEIWDRGYAERHQDYQEIEVAESKQEAAG